MPNEPKVTPIAPPAAAPRLRHTFKIPAAVAGDSEFRNPGKSISLVKLNLGQDIQANKLVVQKDSIFEKVKMALVAIDGKAADWSTGETDDAVERWSPAMRELAFAAFQKLHRPSTEDEKDFLESAVVETY